MHFMFNVSQFKKKISVLFMNANKKMHTLVQNALPIYSLTYLDYDYTLMPYIAKKIKSDIYSQHLILKQEIAS